LHKISQFILIYQFALHAFRCLSRSTGAMKNASPQLSHFQLLALAAIGLVMEEIPSSRRGRLSQD
jgi:hypothetical protein